MRMEYENGVLRIENAEGRRWQIADAEKPRLNFKFDALIVNQDRALRRLGASLLPLADQELEEVATFIGQQQPPPFATLQRQFVADLKVFSYGLINSIVTRLEYDNLLHVQITGREDSTDLYAPEARRVLAYIDSVWNAYYGLTAQIIDTAETELKSFKDYANMIPMPPTLEFFLSDSGPLRKPTQPVNEVHPATASPLAEMNGQSTSSSRAVSVETVTAESADFSKILDRVLVIDDFFSSAQLQLLEQWALQTPHWMLTNSTYNEKGLALHRLWGASYIEAWQRDGWHGLPPILFSTVATIFKKLNVTITTPEYLGLNGQSRGQDASMHTDCEANSPDDLSLLIYIGENTTGDLLLYDKMDRQRLLRRIGFRPNRIIAFDGSIPHQALAPSDDKFRMSVIIRGKYECRRSDLVAGQRKREVEKDVKRAVIAS
jgi:hypothetical protein